MRVSGEFSVRHQPQRPEQYDAISVMNCHPLGLIADAAWICGPSDSAAIVAGRRVADPIVRWDAEKQALHDPKVPRCESSSVTVGPMWVATPAALATLCAKGSVHEACSTTLRR